MGLNANYFRWGVSAGAALSFSLLFIYFVWPISEYDGTNALTWVILFPPLLFGFYQWVFTKPKYISIAEGDLVDLARRLCDDTSNNVVSLTGAKLSLFSHNVAANEVTGTDIKPPSWTARRKKAFHSVWSALVFDWSVILEYAEALLSSVIDIMVSVVDYGIMQVKTFAVLCVLVAAYGVAVRQESFGDSLTVKTLVFLAILGLALPILWQGFWASYRSRLCFNARGANPAQAMSVGPSMCAREAINKDCIPFVEEFDKIFELYKQLNKLDKPSDTFDLRTANVFGIKTSTPLTRDVTAANELIGLRFGHVSSDLEYCTELSQQDGLWLCKLAVKAQGNTWPITEEKSEHAAIAVVKTLLFRELLLKRVHVSQ